MVKEIIYYSTEVGGGGGGVSVGGSSPPRFRRLLWNDSKLRKQREVIFILTFTHFRRRNYSENFKKLPFGYQKTAAKVLVLVHRWKWSETTRHDSCQA